MVRKFSIQGLRLFNSSIDTELTFDLDHNNTILKSVISDKVDYIEIEPALLQAYPTNYLPYST